MESKDISSWIKDSYTKRGKELTEAQLDILLKEMMQNVTDYHTKVGEFIWHPHQEEENRMQLIPEWIHKFTPHNSFD